MQYSHFMFTINRYDEQLELAPRDVVARAIQDQMLGRDESHVLLDISHQPADKVHSLPFPPHCVSICYKFHPAAPACCISCCLHKLIALKVALNPIVFTLEQVLHHFPNIAARCAEAGIDITRDPIPVVPAQHYMCGGVQTGLTGQTSVAGLFACGEVRTVCLTLDHAFHTPNMSALHMFCLAAEGPGVSATYILHADAPCFMPHSPISSSATALRVTGSVHGTARRQPAGEQQPAGGAGVCCSRRQAVGGPPVCRLLIRFAGELAYICELICHCDLLPCASAGLW